MNLTMRKMVSHVLMTALAVPAFVAYGALPEVHLDSLIKRDSGTFDLAGTNFVIGSFVSQVDSSVITTKTATDETPGLTIGENEAEAVLESDEMYPLADGGVLHVFRKDGTLKVKDAGTVSLVLVGGGGAGGDHRGGGGGAGGVVTNAAFYLEKQDYAISVGIGQKRAFTEYILNETGEVKTNRIFSLSAGQTVTTNKVTAVDATATKLGELLTAYPGGGGGTVRSKGMDGASGGGGGGFFKETYVGGSPLYDKDGNLGNRGGTSCYMTLTSATGAGGGGAGTPGEDKEQKAGSSYEQIGGRGGTGVVTRITGRDFWIGGGGNGQGVQTVIPGGGGRGTTATSTNVGKGGAGSAYTGGGGGGSGSTGNDSGLGGDGGSGVALFRISGALPKTVFGHDVRATGGKTVCRMIDGERWCVHTFTEDGTFVLPQGATVEMLLVGGGGGGGSGSGASHAGGGGGGGRVLAMTNYLAAGSYSVVVGSGGDKNANGTSSMFNGYEAVGGGGGGNVRGGGRKGGCGGGGGAWGNDDFAAGGANAVTNDPAEKIGIPIAILLESQWGNPGGVGRNQAGGGGGGAGEPGSDSSSQSLWSPGRGGDGVISMITGCEVCYGGGGGGGAYGSSDHRKNGGAGGGGGGGGTQSATDSAAKSYGLPGEDGLGGGGGGGGGGANGGVSSVNGGRGGNGVVILRYRVEPFGMMIICR